MKKYLYAILLILFSAAGVTAQDEGRILIFGDSITAGYGLEKSQAFPALLQNKVDSLDWNYKVVNAGLSGETSAGGLRRIDWMMRQDFEVFILELGGNDGLRGIDLDATKANLQGIIDKVKKQKPDAHIILAGMQVPPNLGPEYTREFRNMYRELAKKNDITLIPFLLEGVGGYDEYMQGDGIHPNAKGHRKVAENVWEVLKPILEQERS